MQRREAEALQREEARHALQPAVDRLVDLAVRSQHCQPTDEAAVRDLLTTARAAVASAQEAVTSDGGEVDALLASVTNAVAAVNALDDTVSAEERRRDAYEAAMVSAAVRIGAIALTSLSPAPHVMRWRRHPAARR